MSISSNSQDIVISHKANGDITITFKGSGNKNPSFNRRESTKSIPSSNSPDKNKSGIKELEIEEKYIGIIIGYKGNNQEYIKENFNCYVYEKDKKINIKYNDVMKVSLVEEYINKLIKQYNMTKSIDNIPIQKCSVVIGENGSMKKKLEAKYNNSVKICVIQKFKPFFEINGDTNSVKFLTNEKGSILKKQDGSYAKLKSNSLISGEIPANNTDAIFDDSSGNIKIGNATYKNPEVRDFTQEMIQIRPVDINKYPNTSDDIEKIYSDIIKLISD